GVERWVTALGGGQGDLGAGIFEHVVRRGEFLQPEAGLTASVAELVVGGQNHQDFHNALRRWWPNGSDPDLGPIICGNARPDRHVPEMRTQYGEWAYHKEER